jgi:hypothetical protein
LDFRPEAGLCRFVDRHLSYLSVQLLRVSGSCQRFGQPDYLVITSVRPVIIC